MPWLRDDPGLSGALGECEGDPRTARALCRESHRQEAGVHSVTSLFHLLESPAMKSMTGYGQASGPVGAAHARVEIKTVNGRFLDLKTRLPRELSSLEPAVCRHLEGALHRGRVEAQFTLVIHSSDQFEINQPLVQNYQAAAGVARRLGVEGDLTVSTLLQLPGVLIPKEQDFSAPEIEVQLLEVVDRALSQVVEIREREGEALSEDLNARLDVLALILDRLELHQDEFRGYHKEKLESKLKHFFDHEAVIDPGRLAQEVIYYAERADVSEEITRLRSHLERFRELLRQARGSLGKNLNFLCQEMNREMNTITAKSPNPEVSAVGVEGKVEIEKLREQVQNVE